MIATNDITVMFKSITLISIKPRIAGLLSSLQRLILKTVPNLCTCKHSFFNGTSFELCSYSLNYLYSWVYGIISLCLQYEYCTLYYVHTYTYLHAYVFYYLAWHYATNLSTRTKQYIVHHQHTLTDRLLVANRVS